MIRTKDLEEFMKTAEWKYSSTGFKEYIVEIIKRLRAYDKLCHDLKLMIATLSNEVDKHEWKTTKNEAIPKTKRKIDELLKNRGK